MTLTQEAQKQIDEQRRLARIEQIKRYLLHIEQLEANIKNLKTEIKHLRKAIKAEESGSEVNTLGKYFFCC